MTPEHFQLIISDLYEENYKSDFAKDLRENIDYLTDLDWVYQVKFNRSSIVGGGRSVGSGSGSGGGGVGGFSMTVGGMTVDGIGVGGNGGNGGNGDDVGVGVGGDNRS